MRIFCRFGNGPNANVHFSSFIFSYFLLVHVYVFFACLTRFIRQIYCCGIVANFSFGPIGKRWNVNGFVIDAFCALCTKRMYLPLGKVLRFISVLWLLGCMIMDSDDFLMGNWVGVNSIDYLFIFNGLYNEFFTLIRNVMYFSIDWSMWLLLNWDRFDL